METVTTTPKASAEAGERRSKEKEGEHQATSLESAEVWSRRAAEIARTTAERIPAAVVVVVGGGVLLALDAFGVGEVLTAGVVGYAAYRLLRRSAKKREAAARKAAA
jgi:hypothetical protein